MMTNFRNQRKQIVESLEKLGYIKDSRIKRAMLKVKREHFVLPEYREDAYVDTPLPIPGGVTISAPHMHAIFLSALKLKPRDKALEVGAGSGVLLAYMREIVGKRGKVVGTEIIPETYEFCKKNLKKAGYSDIKLFLADGSKGLQKEAPFDKIVVSATCPRIPRPLINQLKLGGIIVAPVGSLFGHQELIYLEKTKEGKIKTKNLGGVIFVPLKGKYGWK
jgi:protein-L-isoaspartate(D-aspartate) O-methyltransferase